MDKLKLKELIRLYEKVIHGDDDEAGLLDFFNGNIAFVASEWEEDFKKIGALHEELKDDNE